MERLAACFADVKDPRSGNAGRHDLIEILVISLSTVMGGGETACDMHRAKTGCDPIIR